MDNPSRVHVTPNRYTLWPPCECVTSIVLQRAITDLQLIHPVSCPVCDRTWKVEFLPDRRRGLWVSWRPT
jgi:hypothetical protein